MKAPQLKPIGRRSSQTSRIDPVNWSRRAPSETRFRQVPVNVRTGECLGLDIRELEKTIQNGDDPSIVGVGSCVRRCCEPVRSGSENGFRTLSDSRYWIIKFNGVIKKRDSVMFNVCI